MQETHEGLYFKITCSLKHADTHTSLTVSCSATTGMSHSTTQANIGKQKAGRYRNKCKQNYAYDTVWHQEFNFSEHVSKTRVYVRSYVNRSKAGEKRLRWSTTCWLLVPKFAGSNPTEAVGFFRAKKSSSRLHSDGK